MIVGLTGGIASGKTAVSDRFAALGVPVIDTDLIARELVQPGEPALERIVAAFGAGVLDADGALDRRRLRDIVFADPGARTRLEAILHPEIRRVALERARRVAAAYCIVVIPLLAEKSGFPGLDRVLVVDVDPATQVERVMARDRVTGDQARSVLAAQCAREARLAIADDVIDNSGSLDELDRQVAAVHRKYLGLAGG